MRRFDRHWLLPLALAALIPLPGAARAQFDLPPQRPAAGGEDRPTLGEKTAEAAKKWNAENLAKYKGNEDYLVLPGLLANRKEKWVQLLGRATGIHGNDPLEFLLIPADSGKDYEALLAAFVRPSDVHKALEFIGRKPGRPVNYLRNQFWSKGERIAAYAQWDQPPGEEGDRPTAQRVRLETLVADARVQKPLAAVGFVFAGSYTFTPEGQDKPLYAADVSDSHSIMSDYNDPSTVLDVPWQWTQGEVYGSLKLAPGYRFTPGQQVLITLEPLHKDGKPRVRDLSLSVSMPEERASLANAWFELKDAEGKRINAKGNSLVHLLAEFNGMSEQGLDPFLTLHVDGRMTLGSVQEVYALLQRFDKEGGVKIDAPAAGDLYYRAFFPREDWKDRTKRLGRPWELHVGEKEGKVSGNLILPADDIDNNGGKGDLHFPVLSAEDVSKTLAEKSDKWSQTVLIYAPASLRYGDLLDFIRPALKTHPTMYVFVAKPSP